MLIHILKCSVDCSYHTEEGVPILEVAIPGKQHYNSGCTRLSLMFLEGQTNYRFSLKKQINILLCLGVNHMLILSQCLYIELV